MKIVYTPEDADERVFSFKPERLYSFDSEPIEESGGEVWANWNGFLEALSERKTRALRAALWHELRQEQPELKFAHVVIRPGEIAGFWEEEEIARFRAVAADPDTPDDIRQGIWDALGKGDAEAPSVTSDSDTDSSSPTTA